MPFSDQLMWPITTRIKLTALFGKIAARDPTVFPAWEALRMATIEGAQAHLHVSVQAGDEVGSLEMGKGRRLTALNLWPVPACLQAPGLCRQRARGQDGDGWGQGVGA
jgi:cytosine/adenosine deaminase-related metal-dependent hydrolase